jgi:signal transduction histidine kinase
MVRGNTSSGDKNAKAGAPEAGKSTTASAASVDKPSSDQPCLVVGIFNLIPADIGRPFQHLAGKIDWPTLSHDAEAVLAGHPFAEREVASLDSGRCYLKRIFPYRTREGNVDGLVVTLGEMIGNIAHQWRQPLNFLGLTIQQLPLMYDLGKIDREFLNQCVSSSMEVIQHMSRTIDDFRNYFRPDKERIKFNVHDAIVNTLSLLEGTLQTPQIGITIVAKNDPVIFGYQNEFSQVILNILMNARDALLERNIADPRVTITICSEGGCAVVTISDSAGGISEDIIDKIFDPYFTTKGPQQGTGVGLFMSKTIIEKNMGGDFPCATMPLALSSE